MLTRKVGNVDRCLRAILANAALAAFFMLPTTPILHWVYLVVGVIGVGTAAISSCPIYTIFGLRTCPMKTGE